VYNNVRVLHLCSKLSTFTILSSLECISFSFTGFDPVPPHRHSRPGIAVRRARRSRPRPQRQPHLHRCVCVFMCVYVRMCVYVCVFVGRYLCMFIEQRTNYTIILIPHIHWFGSMTYDTHSYLTYSLFIINHKPYTMHHTPYTKHRTLYTVHHTP
jgi:hypothetical protein